MSSPPVTNESSASTERKGSVPSQNNVNGQHNHEDLPEHDDAEPEYDERRPYVYTGIRHGAGYRKPRRGSATKIPMEFDQHGAELGKDARFWRIYVEETDDWDEELVHGWNKSLDVTLVFAALFSAILTGFLIEVSGRLREDSGNEMSKTLVIVSQALIIIANSTRSEHSVSDLETRPTTSTPSRAAVLVNTLWYLSLSLSVATSFLAMLGKNWCHSFMAGRTGPPCMQARRRQQKWTMIERWKMQEFLVMLPSIIHLALLLFSIGLCIYVWDLNQTSALPVICVTGIAVGFYICSSLAASILDFFPYTTTTSRILRSKLMKEVYLVTLWILQPALVFLAFIPMLFLITAERLTQCSSVLHRRVDHWLESFVEWSNSSLVMLPRNFPEARRDENPKQDRVTSNALYWLIRNCEVPSSVDIALQAIAGANQDLPRQPLEACKAALLISRRLVSGRPYKESATDRQRIDLYVSALSFLGSHSVSISQDVAPNSSANEVEVMIWDLQSENENEAASLITDGNFMPADHNLLALRIGSTAASQGLRRLSGRSDETMPEIIQLLRQHLDGIHELHSAALVSLINAAILLSICSPHDSDTILLASLCMQLFDKNMYWLYIEPKYGITLTMCALLQNKHADRESLVGQASTRWTRSALHILLETQTPRKDVPENLAWFAATEVLSNPEAYGIEFSQSPKLYHLLDSAVKSILSIWDTIPVEQHTCPNNIVVESHLSNLQRIYALARVGTPIADVYVYVVESMCRVPSDRAKELCGSLLSGFCFPRLSVEMVECMERCNLVKVLKTALRHESEIVQFFGISQLWLLHVLYQDSYSTDTANRDRLLQQLKLYSPEKDEAMEQVLCHLTDEMGARFQTVGSQLGSLNVYICRILECILQARGGPSSEAIWVKVQAALVNVPSSLRGLGSSTRLPMHNSPTLSLHNSPPHISIMIQKSEA
ncbi:transmembrane protein, putative [Rhizoctonia solani AG-3 Rhs1AP]|uniref:Transmembrane protein, putative n=1 Tax=Rhizoctonia solani AG-3 Rhs1AP TaxID=1086054 RepID=X8J230_9AGAM|nr:transmembrane protein, putative [Rhizoctonia solani AG-3 Rhs1AP]